MVKTPVFCKSTNRATAWPVDRMALFFEENSLNTHDGH
jgi:hypothetical protein